jgi:hypothetical protein
MADEKSEKPKLKEFDLAHFHYEGKRFEARAVSRGEFEALKRFGDYEELVSSFHGCESRATNVYMVSTHAVPSAELIPGAALYQLSTLNYLRPAAVPDGFERSVECAIARIDLAFVELRAPPVRLDGCAAAHHCFAALFDSCKPPRPVCRQYSATESRRGGNLG